MISSIWTAKELTITSKTRKEIDMARIAYFGPSASGYKIVLAALESRYRAVMFNGSSIRKQQRDWIATANPINFAPRIRASKLMTHGGYDEAAPLETEGKALFDLMRERKRLILFDSGHVPAPHALMPTLNGWLDEVLDSAATAK
jgi:hypothetical protein